MGEEKERINGGTVRERIDGSVRRGLAAVTRALSGAVASLRVGADGAPKARRRRRLVVLGVAVATLAGSGLIALPAAFAQADPCNPVVNPIVCENSKPGTPGSVWQISGTGDESIQGFSTDISVNAGQSIGFKIKTNARAYSIEIYRLGYYNGDGARKVDTISPSASLPQSQPTCIHSAATDMTDCGNWAISATWNAPSTAVSGVYIARLIRADTGGDSHIPFVVRNDASTSPLFFQTSDATWHAYNSYGGANFYFGSSYGRAYKISYNRPILTRGAAYGRDFLFANEYPMIRFLERNGYDMSYTTNVDSDRRGNLIKNHDVFLSVGHDEYWSGQQRANVEAARDAGVNLAFFSGNEVYWKTRWEPSTDGSNTTYRTLVCYKETWSDDKIDPSSEWTGTWRDPRFSPPSNGGKPENGLTGTAYMANSDDLPIQVPAEQGKLRFWRNTSVANLSAGQTATLAEHLVGYESNEDLDNGFRPSGLIRLSTTVGDTPELLRDFGKVVTPGTTTHHMTLYRAGSGALVFSAGTIQYAWGLDDEHDGFANAPADPRLQQATVNLFADMGVQPDSLMSGLVLASSSTDATAPTAAITAPAEGASIARGSSVTLTGTAADTGGRVAGVEVSTDGGTTWHPATGTSSWSYTFIASGMSTLTVSVRATDDSANIGTNPTTRSFSLTGPHSLFGAKVPQFPSTSDTSAVELGIRFKPQTSGVVTGIRFYKGTGNNGTHTGSLWASDGTRLATGNFINESGSGWQTMSFSTPVNVTAGVWYVASYRAPNGRYAADPWSFSYRDWVSGPLLASRSIGGTGNGLFSTGNGMPDSSFEDTNYYVDVTFISNNDAAPYAVSTSPLSESTGVPLNVTPSAVFSKSLVASSVQFTLKDPSNATVAGTTAYNDSLKSITFTPSAPLTAATVYTATASGSDSQGNLGSVTWSFTTDFDSSVLRLFAVDATPAVLADPDTAPVELGVKFTAAVSGKIVGLRYYQGPGNTGTHVGHLWTVSGTSLGQLTFGAGSGSGWQSAAFPAPISITAGTTYVASYFAPNGHYSATANFFSSTWNNYPLSAPSGANGVYTYASSSTFPTSSYNSTNYWVDPLFVPDGPLPSPTPTPSPTATASPTPSPTASPTPTPTSTQPAVTFFQATETPAVEAWNDPDQLEVGMKFTADVAGEVLGVKFYKGATNTGTHTGSLWTAGGVLKATGTFTNETATGWQTLTFSQPVELLPNTVYVVSYHTNVGNYAVTGNYFTSAIDRPPLHVTAQAAVYRYGGGGSCPTSPSNHNYWVDVIFRPF